MSMQVAEQWFVGRIARPKASQRLLCFHHAGGNAGAYRGWAKRVPEHIDVCPVELPGRWSRGQEPLETRISDFVPRMGAALRPYLELPCALMGYSLGAILAFELAHWMSRELAQPPVCLFLAACDGPRLSRTRTPPAHALEPAEFLSVVAQHFQPLPAIVRESEAFLQLLLPIMKADFELFETYAPSSKAPLSCPIRLYLGQNDPLLSDQAASAWRTETTATFDVRSFVAGHFFLNEQREVLIQDIVTTLATMAQQQVTEPNRA